MLIAPTHGIYVGVSIPQALETRADATPAGARHSDGAAPGVGVAGGERGERRRSARPHRIQGAARIWRLLGILERIVPTAPSASVRGQWRGACRLVAGRLGRVQSRAYQKGSQDK